MSEQNLRENEDGAKVRVSYDVTEAMFASQFIVTANDDEVIINFSSGHISDPASGEAILPINCRVAVSKSGAKRLISTLAQAVEKPGQTAVQARFPEPRVKLDN